MNKKQIEKLLEKRETAFIGIKQEDEFAVTEKIFSYIQKDGIHQLYFLIYNRSECVGALKTNQKVAILFDLDNNSNNLLIFDGNASVLDESDELVKKFISYYPMERYKIIKFNTTQIQYIYKNKTTKTILNDKGEINEIIKCDRRK